MLEYDTLPIKTFVKILHDENNIHLLGTGSDKEEWERIKGEWEERNPGKDGIRLTSAYKKVLFQSIKLNKELLLLKLLIQGESDQKEMFKAAGIRYHEDPVKRYEHLDREISKSSQKLQIYKAQYDQVEKEIRESNQNQERNKPSISDINRAIASLELSGFTIENYETLTCGKYDAMTAIQAERARKSKKKNG